ncbi:Thiol-disulfide isomerase or thioredoxin [Peptoclostridium litorale DSM 5388]|uniref:Thioredoxin domain-containing protein n=1 Tax=Peptoclostridium litorale DSM 5388 TaxID=1121324 RepID=A0A069RNJ6_PEPLI|nr:TlpA disulfide reductase family protein [Peptoclostridium litorale]KDR95762.1 thioredoxin domain-containing protein [Peptoclostridium litorale DSM 5388]SIO21830.1 Thiol-disulfide isomerase or thioredoxin [Peptoclostridium litorale DSM 5388]
MNRIYALLLVLALAVSATGCSKKDEKAAGETNMESSQENAEDLIKVDELGIQFEFPQSWQNSENLNPMLLGPVDEPSDPIYGRITYDFISSEKMKEIEEKGDSFETQEEAEGFWKDVFSTQKKIADIVILHKDRIDGMEDVGKYTQLKNNEIIGENSGLVYYFSYNEPDTKGLSEESKRLYSKLYGDRKKVKDSVGIFKPHSPEDKLAEVGSIPDFSAKDTKGKDVDASIFEGHKLTMVNIWATYCSPCIEEMPELQGLYEEMKGRGVNVVGIIGDTPDAENEEMAMKIIDVKGVEFTNIIPDGRLKDGLISTIVGYPTSVFIDKDGNMVGKPVVGSRSKEEYESIIDGILKEMQE